MPDIDLETAGKITSSGLNAKDYTFIIMKAQDHYTAAALAANPNAVSAGDILVKSAVIPDQAGKAEFDLKAQAKTLKEKLGSATNMDVKIAVIGTAKATNGDPKKRLADVVSYKLMKGTPSLKLNPQKKEIDVQEQGSIAIEIKFLDGATIKAEPAGVFHLSKTSLNQTGDVMLTALKDGKATITVQGMEGGAAKITEKVEITSKGPNVAIAAIGMKDA